MEHELFFDGNVKEYTWAIKTGDTIANQIREHPASYLSGGKLNIKNNEESKFVALHVGIYWGLGVSIIKNDDKVNIKCDSKEMISILSQKKKIDNQIINDKIYFINQLTRHRKLEIIYEEIKPIENLAAKYLFSKNDDGGRDSRNYV